ncbi:MAG: response regulator [Planctomycetota bacterium]
MDCYEQTVLVAEDNPALLRVTQFTLERAGLKVHTATDGQSALEKLEEFPYGLLVTDQQMPRLCGIDLIRAARQLPNHADTPMVLLTAKAMELDRDGLVAELGVVDILRKPFSPMEVSRLAQKLLAAAV